MTGGYLEGELHVNETKCEKCGAKIEAKQLGGKVKVPPGVWQEIKLRVKHDGVLVVVLVWCSDACAGVQ